MTDAGMVVVVVVVVVPIDDILLHPIMAIKVEERHTACTYRNCINISCWFPMPALMKFMQWITPVAELSRYES